MKKIIFLLAIFFAAALTNSQAQNTWRKKANFGANARISAVGFSIGSKGYMGLGRNYVKHFKDFWEYDPSAGTWTQKADFGGGHRSNAVGFNIETKGYVGTGHDNDFKLYKDFWEYDPVANIWTQKANFGGTARWAAVGFNIGSKGYLGTGYNYPTSYKDFWEYDPAKNIWSRKADIGGSARSNAVGFSIGSKGYVGTGKDSTGISTKDFWEYDPAANIWTHKADFGGNARIWAIGFSIGSRGYLGTGELGYPIYGRRKDFWEYDPAANIWVQKAYFGGDEREQATGFSIGSKGYLAAGSGYAANLNKDFWEYTPDTIICALATNLSVTNITSSSAILRWDALPGAEGYRVRYKSLNSNEWVDKASLETSEKITDLLPGIAYRWEVTTYCKIDFPQIKSNGSAKGEFTTATLSVSKEDVQRVSFQIYPVPAKDILHIQTNGSASFSLVNQVGKILVTKNINGSGIINVGGFAAGVYYLKNNSSGAVQKVVIAR